MSLFTFSLRLARVHSTASTLSWQKHFLPVFNLLLPGLLSPSFHALPIHHSLILSSSSSPFIPTLCVNCMNISPVPTCVHHQVKRKQPCIKDSSSFRYNWNRNANYSDVFFFGTSCLFLLIASQHWWIWQIINSLFMPRIHTKLQS